MSAQAVNLLDNTPKRRHWGAQREQRAALSNEDMDILATLEMLKTDLDNIYKSLDSVTDPILIDSFIYEINAINMRYKFYLQMCKDKGIVSAMF